MNNPMKLSDNLNDLSRASDLLGISSVSMDLLSSLCGEFIGSGVFRAVFDYNLDPNYVIKVEPLNTDCNIMEYTIWNEVQGLTGDLNWVRDWFAPVKWVSPNGRILVMKKTKPHDYKKERPNRVPKFLWDVKPDNFGWIGKNYVCHDYGQIYSLINYSKTKKKIEWQW